MNCCRRFALVFLLAAMTLGQPAAARAGDLLAWFRKPQPAAQPAPCNQPPITVAAPPGPYRWPAYANGNYPWYGYGFGVPTYQWGYCGSTFRPVTVCHHGYYGDFSQFGYRWGY